MYRGTYVYVHGMIMTGEVSKILRMGANKAREMKRKREKSTTD
jgi:hypothetical protein